ncbi:MAG: class I SAM-dependent methyltransferase [Candidatus Latescibacteria bacterium]|jgi:cyclopropane-fatty-acyl-phospholipid synthase|nr:class I SAM-dependent methyltransferase [Candidatus Latescibacterota bacterium]MBT4136433.1 class I SAM-dependent methyltransferase [Candidatus Latescibacterota bacterium]
MSFGIRLAEKGLLPDFLIRHGIRGLQQQRLDRENMGSCEVQNRMKRTFIEHMDNSPVALHTEAANDQHYELPPQFFQYVMGDHLKYSSCYFETGNETLSDAEAAMLAVTCERAVLEDGQDVLELGCGWGSLTLWMASHYPNSQITAVSNSKPQRAFIEAQCEKRGLNNVVVITSDMNDFEAPETYDRVVSVEMFEHLRNYRMMLNRIAGWLKDEGQVFIHVFTHRDFPYRFETTGENDWMGKLFFTGGIMPSDDLFLYFQDDVTIEDHWAVDGRHYAKTADAWLANMGKHKAEVLEVLGEHYGADERNIWFQRWRIFFLACSELWGFNEGQEWGVSHYRFAKKGVAVNEPQSVLDRVSV